MTESSGHIASGAGCRKKRKIWLLNLLFLLAGAGILFLLWLAPPASTPAMPKDEHHAPYQTGSKRAAEKTLPGMPRAGNVQSPAQTASAAVPLPLLPPQGLKDPET